MLCHDVVSCTEEKYRYIIKVLYPRHHYIVFYYCAKYFQRPGLLKLVQSLLLVDCVNIMSSVESHRTDGEAVVGVVVCLLYMGALCCIFILQHEKASPDPQNRFKQAYVILPLDIL